MPILSRPAFNRSILLTVTTSIIRMFEVPRDKGQHDGHSKRAASLGEI